MFKIVYTITLYLALQIGSNSRMSAKLGKIMLYLASAHISVRLDDGTTASNPTEKTALEALD